MNKALIPWYGTWAQGLFSLLTLWEIHIQGVAVFSCSCSWKWTWAFLTEHSYPKDCIMPICCGDWFEDNFTKSVMYNYITRVKCVCGGSRQMCLVTNLMIFQWFKCMKQITDAKVISSGGFTSTASSFTQTFVCPLSSTLPILTLWGLYFDQITKLQWLSYSFEGSRDWGTPGIVSPVCVHSTFLVTTNLVTNFKFS